MAPASVPLDWTFSVPLSMVPVAMPSEVTVSVPPLKTIVPLATPTE
jgi:hypothetical protein